MDTPASFPTSVANTLQQFYHLNHLNSMANASLLPSLAGHAADAVSSSFKPAIAGLLAQGGVTPPASVKTEKTVALSERPEVDLFKTDGVEDVKKKLQRRVCFEGPAPERKTRKRRVESAETGEKKRKLSGRWTSSEHSKFLEGLRKFGKDWRNIAAYIGTRNYVQTRTHAQKYFKKVAKLRQELGEEIPFEFMSTANNGSSWQLTDQEVKNQGLKSKPSRNRVPKELRALADQSKALAASNAQTLGASLNGLLSLPNGYPYYPQSHMMNPFYGLNHNLLSYLTQPLSSFVPPNNPSSSS